MNFLKSVVLILNLTTLNNCMAIALKLFTKCTWELPVILKFVEIIDDISNKSSDFDENSLTFSDEI